MVSDHKFAIGLLNTDQRGLGVLLPTCLHTTGDDFLEETKLIMIMLPLIRPIV